MSAGAPAAAAAAPAPGTPAPAAPAPAVPAAWTPAPAGAPPGVPAAGAPAAGASAPGTTAPELQLVCFRMGGEEFALGIMRIREIVRPQRIVRVPKAPSFVEGVINLRGEILPVVDLRRRLGLPHDTDERRTRFLVVGLERSVVVFVVDEVTEVVRVPRDAVLPAPALVRGPAESPAGVPAGVREADCLIGVLPLGERLVMLLHPGRVLSAAEARELREASLGAGGAGEAGAGSLGPGAPEAAAAEADAGAEPAHEAAHREE